MVREEFAAHILEVNCDILKKLEEKYGVQKETSIVGKI